MHFKVSLKTTASAFTFIALLISSPALQAMKEGDETPEQCCTTPARKPENEKKKPTEELYNLAVQYQYGRGVIKDLREAARLYQLAADEGDPASQCNLGVMYLEGLGIAKDERMAFELFQKAANQGLAKAQYSIAALYFEGRGVKKNEGKALEYLILAAGQGYSNAISALESMGINFTIYTLKLH